MYISSSHNQIQGWTYYVLEHEGHVKKVYRNDLTETTVNRCMYETIVDVLKSLKKPCHLTIITRGPIGGVLILKGKTNAVNGDWYEKILKAANDGGHDLEFVYESTNKEIKAKLEYTRVRLKELKIKDGFGGFH